MSWDMAVCIGTDDAKAPPWPAWAPVVAPQYHAVALGDWIASGRAAWPALARTAAPRQPVHNGTVALRPTLRVKFAYLRMNATGIAERLEQVGQRIDSLVRMLRDVSPDDAASWRPPEGTQAMCATPKPVDDLNVLYVPCKEAYNVD